MRPMNDIALQIIHGVPRHGPSNSITESFLHAHSPGVPLSRGRDLESLSRGVKILLIAGPPGSINGIATLWHPRACCRMTRMIT